MDVYLPAEGPGNTDIWVKKMQKLHKKFTNSVISDKTESEREDTERTRMVSYFCTYSYLHMCIGVQTHYVCVLYWGCFTGLSLCGGLGGMELVASSSTKNDLCSLVLSQILASEGLFFGISHERNFSKGGEGSHLVHF